MTAETTVTYWLQQTAATIEAERGRVVALLAMYQQDVNRAIDCGCIDNASRYAGRAAEYAKILKAIDSAIAK